MSKKSESFGKYLRRFSDEPEKLRSRLKCGMAIEYSRRALMARVHPSSYSTMIDYLAMKQVASATGSSDRAFVSLLVPSEILLAAGIMPISAEALSGVLCAMNLEDIAIGKSDQMSLSQTLCTFHRASAGASSWGIFPSPKLVVAASTLCDGNDGTFKFIAEKLKSPFFLIDVPRGRKAEYVPYVEKQLEELIALVEDITGRAFSLERLSEILEVEEETRHLLDEGIESIGEDPVPLELFQVANSVVVLHTLAGSSELLKGVKGLFKRRQPERTSNIKKLLWLHIPPYYETGVSKMFSPERNVRVVSSELCWDWMYPLNPAKPVRSLAEKLIFNFMNGTVQERAAETISLSRKLGVDGVIHFSHWGCRQSSGAVGVMKREFTEQHIPFLSIDGDCIDRSSSNEQQLITRIRAFLEILGV